MSDIPDDCEGVDVIFRDAHVTLLSNYDLDRQYPDIAGVDDEHLRSEFQFQQERRNPVPCWKEQMSSQELEDERFMSALQKKGEQILAGARFEI